MIQAAPEPGLTFVTVVPAAEVPLLGLQARSLAVHGAGLDRARVLVLVNDRNEAQVRGQVDALRAEWGALADRVRVAGGAELFLVRPNSVAARIKALVAAVPWMQGISRGGWRGNDGWRLQQAFKLAAARIVDTSHIVYLDAKNLFIRPLEMDDFIAPDGRARSWFSAHEGKSAYWLGQSQRALGLPVAPVPQEVTTYITPFAVQTDLVRALLAAFEARNGPVQNHFAMRLNNMTEFMLVNAWCNLHLGGVRAVFAEGGMRSYTLWGDVDLMQRILIEARDLGGKCIGLHRRALVSMSESNRDLATALMIKGGVIAGRGDLDTLARQVAGTGQGRPT
jgi:hypothetical protein